MQKSYRNLQGTDNLTIQDWSPTHVRNLFNCNQENAKFRRTSSALNPSLKAKVQQQNLL